MLFRKLALITSHVSAPLFYTPDGHCRDIGGSTRNRGKRGEPLGGHPQRRVEAEVGHVSEPCGWLALFSLTDAPYTWYLSSLLGLRLFFFSSH